jgi:hypothetical protein
MEEWMLFEGVKAGNNETWIDQTVVPLVEKMLAEIEESK